MSDTPTIEIRRFPSRAQLNAALVQRLERAIGEDAPGGTALMLSGGSTPMPAYREVASRSPRPAPGLHVLFSDDRYVPSTTDASNYHQSLPLLNALALQEAAVLRVKTELPLEKAAQDYEQRIDALLLSGATFRLGLLGLGADGHTASLFSGDDLNRSKGHRAIAVNRPDGMQAVSVTPEVLALFSELIFVVAGADKHNAVQSLIRHDTSLPAYGAIASRSNAVLWLADA
jgi:6-phosphogluconolactonase